MELLLYLFTQGGGRQSCAVQVLGFDKLHEAFESAHESCNERGGNLNVILYPEAFHHKGGVSRSSLRSVRATNAS